MRTPARIPGVIREEAQTVEQQALTLRDIAHVEQEVLSRRVLMLVSGLGVGDIVRQLHAHDVVAVGVDMQETDLGIYGMQYNMANQDAAANDLGQFMAAWNNYLELPRRERGDCEGVLCTNAPADWVISLNAIFSIDLALWWDFLENLKMFTRRGLVVQWAEQDDDVAWTGVFISEILVNHFRSMGWWRHYNHERLLHRVFGGQVRVFINPMAAPFVAPPTRSKME